MSSEVEYKGIKLKGSKLLLLLPILGTLGGLLWGGFEFTKDYMNMRDKINEYVAPDLSNFTIKLDVLEERMTSLEGNFNIELVTVKELVGAAQDDARTIRIDLRKDINDVQDQIADSDKRTREVNLEIRTSIRNSENTIRGIITNNESRMSNLVESSMTRFSAKRDQIESDFTKKSEAIDTKLIELEERLNKTLERYFKNPLLTGE